MPTPNNPSTTLVPHNILPRTGSIGMGISIRTYAIRMSVVVLWYVGMRSAVRRTRYVYIIYPRAPMSIYAGIRGGVV